MIAAVAAVFVALVIQRMLELRVARRNAAAARTRGATEFGAAHYPLFFALHGAWMVAWPAEAIIRDAPPGAWPLWLIAILAAQVLRYWAITSLGGRWNTRILVVPGDVPLRAGPYRWISHPNYVAVVIELAAVPLMFGAWSTALVATIANLALLLAVRIPAERQALQWAQRQRPPT